MPGQAQLVFPLLAAAADAGGAIRSQDAYVTLADWHGLPEEIRSETVELKCGQRHNLWERHVRFAKERAKHAGFIVAGEAPGIWRLTDEGKEAVRRAQTAVVARVVTDTDGNAVGAQIELNTAIPTIHSLHCGDARDLSWISSGEIPLIVTSIPYFDLKEYEHASGQLADIVSYEKFVDAMADAMRECYRVLTPGGRIAVNVGDVLRSRSKHGTHEVLPLSADLTVACRRIGFSALTGIIWQKMSNCSYEEGRGGVLGQPGMPRMVIKSETENILLFKKPGPNFSATKEQREASRIAKDEWQKWVRGIWSDIPGQRAGANHPAPYPVEVPYRLIRMLSYTGPEAHTVLDPFAGGFTTAKAAMRAQRHSASVEIAPGYFRRGIEILQEEAQRIVSAARGGNLSPA
jgi:modification methylase